MVHLILLNLLFVLIAVALLTWAWLTNFTLALVNMKVTKTSFDRERFYQGIWKAALAILGTAMLAILITTLPVAAIFIGIPIPDDYIPYISVAAILLIYWRTILYYAKQAHEKLQTIFTAEGIVIEGIPPDGQMIFNTTFTPDTVSRQ